MSAFIPLGYIGLKDAVSTAVDGAMDGGRQRPLTLEDALLDGPRRAQVEAVAWRLVRTALLFQNMPSFALSTYDGLVSIPPSVWGTLAPMTPPERIAFDPGSGKEDMMVLLRTVDFLAYLEGKFAMAEQIPAVIPAPRDDCSAGIVSTASGEAACQRWLEEQMRACPERRPRSKDDIKRDALPKFSISARGFDRSWDKAISDTGSKWNRAGASPKRGQK